MLSSVTKFANDARTIGSCWFKLTIVDRIEILKKSCNLPPNHMYITTIHPLQFHRYNITSTMELHLQYGNPSRTAYQPEQLHGNQQSCPSTPPTTRPQSLNESQNSGRQPLLDNTAPTSDPHLPQQQTHRRYNERDEHEGQYLPTPPKTPESAWGVQPIALEHATHTLKSKSESLSLAAGAGANAEVEDDIPSPDTALGATGMWIPDLKYANARLQEWKECQEWLARKTRLDEMCKSRRRS